MTGTIEITGTGGIIEGNLGAANVNVNLDPVYGNYNATTSSQTSNAGGFDSIWQYDGGCVSAWIYPKSDGEGNYARIFDKAKWTLNFIAESGTNAKIEFYHAFSTTYGSWRTTNYDIPYDAWTHIAVVYDSDSAANNAVLYVNGVAVAVTESSTPVGTATSDASDDLYIGNRAAGDRTFDGYIMDVKIYKNVAVTATNVAKMASKINVDKDAPDMPTSGIQGWYKFNASTTADSSGVGNNLTAANMGSVVYDAFSVDVQDTATTDGNFTITQGKVEGKALTSLDFERTNTDFVSLASTMSKPTLATYAVWMKPETSGSNYGYPFAESNNKGWYYFTTNDCMQSIGLSPSLTGTTGSVPENVWTHFAVTYDGTTSTMYINGVADVSGTGDHRLDLARLGDDNGDGAECFDGKLRDWRVYDYCLTADQMASLYSGNYNVTPLHHWTAHPYDLSGASNVVADTGTATAINGTKDGAAWDDGTLDLDGELQLQANGTLSAPRGLLTLSGGNNAFHNNCTNPTTQFIHNNGEVEFDGSNNRLYGGTATATGTHFYNLTHDSSGYLDGYEYITVENKLTTKAGQAYYINDSGKVFIGTSTVAGEFEINGSLNLGTNGQTYIEGVGGAALPALIDYNGSISGASGDTGGATAYLNLTNINWDGALTMGTTNIKLGGDAEFDAVTVSNGAELDLNEQRVEFSGLNMNYTGTVDATNSLIFLNAKDSGYSTRIFDISTFTNTGSTVIVDHDSPLLQIQGNESFNNLMFRGTNDAIDNDITTTGNVYFTGTDFPSTNSQNWTIGGDLVVATGSELDGQSSDFYVAGDFIASGGIIGDSAFDFDGASGVINCGSDSSLDNIFAGGGTVEVWINVDGDGETGSGRIFDKNWDLRTFGHSGDTVKIEFSQFFASGKYQFQTGAVLTTGKWHHVAMTYNNADPANRATLYVDGKSVPLTTTVDTGSGAATDDSSSDLLIGNRAADDKTLEGRIGMVRIFDDIRTAAELRADMFSSSFSDSTCDVTGGGENTVTCDANTNIKVGQEVHGDSGTVFIPAATTVASITEAGGAGTGVTSFELSGSGSTETHTNTTLKFNRMANVGNLVLFYQFDEGTGTYVKDRSQGPTTVRGTITAGSSAWAGRGEWHNETSTIFMNASYGTQNIKFISGIWFNNLYIENGSTTNLYTIGTTGGNTNHSGDMVVHGTFQTHSSSPSNSIALRNGTKKMFFPQALEFDGSNDYVAFGVDDSAYLNGHSKITISTWVKADSTMGNTATGKIVSKDNVFVLGMWSGAAGKARFYIRDSSGWQQSGDSTTAINDNKWHHVMGIYDGSTIQIWIDGVKETQASHASATMQSQSNALAIGAEPTGSCFKGAIADVRIYSRDLNATEIALVKSQIVPNDAPTADLIGHWKLDETSGTTAVDSSTSGNNGTHTNSPTKFGNKATAVADIYHWETVLQTHSDASKILDLPSCTMNSFRSYYRGDNVRAKGDITFNQELQIDSGTVVSDFVQSTFNANGNTITTRLIDVNGGILDLRNSTVDLTREANFGLDFTDTSTLTTSNTTINGYSDHSAAYLPKAGNFEVVGNVSDLKIMSGGDLTVIGSVTDCSFEDSDTNIRQWHHALDTQQLLDADEKGDDDMKLPRPSLDNAHQLQTGG